MKGGKVAQFLRFLLSGGFAAVVNIVSRYELTPALGFELAVLTAYAIGMVTAYALFRTLVFAPSGRGIASEAYRFGVVNLVALSLVWSVSVFLARIFFPAIHFACHAEDIAHLIGVSIPALTSFIGHKKYTFKQ